MDATIKAILGLSEDKSQHETRTYTIRSHPEHLDAIEQLFSWINMTRGGHSGTASIAIDGDGAARVEINKEKGDLKPYEKEDVHDSERIEYSVNLE